jgi:hypothetical protein
VRKESPSGGTAANTPMGICLTRYEALSYLVPRRTSTRRGQGLRSSSPFDLDRALRRQRVVNVGFGRLRTLRCTETDGSCIHRVSSGTGRVSMHGAWPYLAALSKLQEVELVDVVARQPFVQDALKDQLRLCLPRLRVHRGAARVL